MDLRDCYVNVYELDCVYGGPEEGGWWYDEGTPVLSLKVEAADRALTIQQVVEGLRSAFPDEGNRRSSLYRHYPDKNTDYRILIEDAPAKAWPVETPRYE